MRKERGQWVLISGLQCLLVEEAFCEMLLAFHTLSVQETLLTENTSFVRDHIESLLVPWEAMLAILSVYLSIALSFVLSAARAQAQFHASFRDFSHSLYSLTVQCDVFVSPCCHGLWSSKR
jgi:hypothetical protein